MLSTLVVCSRVQFIVVPAGHCLSLIGLVQCKALARQIVPYQCFLQISYTVKHEHKAFYKYPTLQCIVKHEQK